MREGHAASLRSAQAMMESYTTLVSGVLIGMSEDLDSATSQERALKKQEP